MLSMHVITLLASFLILNPLIANTQDTSSVTKLQSTTAVASAQDTTSVANAQDPTPAPQSAKRYLKDCDKDEKAIEAKAWRDHLAIAKEGAKWKSDGRWQPVFDMYMGKDSKDNPYYDAIKKAQKNQVSVHSSNWLFPQAWVFVFCKEKDGKSPKNKDKSFCDSYTYAYAWTVEGYFHNAYNIVFCPKYYQEKKEAKTIVDAIKSGQKHEADGLWQWMAYGQSYYHELMHFGPGLINETVYPGRMADLIKPFQLALIARQFGAKGVMYEEAGDKIYLSTMYLADAYATTATFTYFMEQVKSPIVPTQPDPRVAVSYTTGGSVVLPDLDAHSPEYKDANLPYDATKEDWSFQALGLTDDNLPLLYPDSTISEDEINALFADNGGDEPPDETPPDDSDPAEWQGPNGPVKKGDFQFFVLPNYSQPKKRRRSLLVKRVGGPIEQPGVTIPIPQSARSNATLEVFVQDGAKYKKAGPLKIDCTKDQDAWQYFDQGQINTKYGLSIQSGHACSGIQSDNNLDNIHVKYSDQYVNIQGEDGDGDKCSKHDGGASCVLSVD